MHFVLGSQRYIGQHDRSFAPMLQCTHSDKTKLNVIVTNATHCLHQNGKMSQYRENDSLVSEVAPGKRLSNPRSAMVITIFGITIAWIRQVV